MGLKAESKQLMEKAGVPLVPGYHGGRPGPGAAAARGRPHRLPGADQGQRRRRRQGHARGAVGRGLRRRAGLVQARGDQQLRRRRGADRELRAAPAPHRDPGVRRHARQLRLPVRARLLGAAPPPEGAGGSAGAGHDARRRARDGRGRGGGGARGELRRRRHGGIHRRAGRPLLLHGDEHAPAGRASGDRGHHRARPRRVAAARGLRRAAAAKQDELQIHGHAIEARICAENPEANFLPATGTLSVLQLAGARSFRRNADGDGFQSRRGAHRHGRARGRRDLAVLRLDDRQADRLGRGPRAGAGAARRGAGADAHRRRRQQRAFLRRVAKTPSFAQARPRHRADRARARACCSASRACRWTRRRRRRRARDGAAASGRSAPTRGRAATAGACTAWPCSASTSSCRASRWRCC